MHSFAFLSFIIADGVLLLAPLRGALAGTFWHIPISVSPVGPQRLARDGNYGTADLPPPLSGALLYPTKFNGYNAREACQAPLC